MLGRPLILGGIEIPSDLGELGHSDGDVLYHAIIDAMLGAVAAGDIGRHFSPSDSRWKDASSVDLLDITRLILAEAGWRVISLDSTVILERPRLAPLIDDIRASISDALGLPLESVSVKAKTNEGLGPVGRLEAVEAQAIVLLEPMPRPS